MPPSDGTSWDVFWSLAGLVVALGCALLLVAWPCAEAVRRRRIGWALATVLLAPLGGIGWFVVGRDGVDQPRYERSTRSRDE